jgi:hypothetical protein
MADAAAPDVSKILASLKSVPDFTGDGEPDTASSNWKMYKDKFKTIMDLLNVTDPMQLLKYASSKLDGKAAQLFFSKQNITTWDQMDELFTKQLLSHLDDDFAKRSPWLENSGYITSGKDVKPMLERLDSEMSSAPTPPSDVEKICLAMNALCPDMRAIVRADASGAFPTSFSAWAPYANAKLASFEMRSGSNNGAHTQQQYQHHRPYQRQQQQQRPLAEHVVPGHERTRCIKCNNLGHPNVLAKNGERYVCPEYDPNFKRNGKRHHT